MTNKNKAIIIALILIVIIGVVYFINKKEDNSTVIVPPAALLDMDAFIAKQKGEVCYYRETIGEQSTDNSFVSINYDTGNEVHGIINRIPGEKDSLVGAYTGVIEKNETMAGYPFRINALYAGTGEGILSYQQEIIAVSENNIKTGSGERYLDADSVHKFKDLAALVYDNALPKVDCAGVPEKISADYSMNK